MDDGGGCLSKGCDFETGMLEGKDPQESIAFSLNLQKLDFKTAKISPN